ncbi:MAG: peptide deformylase [Candidatus Eisenbacteria bacterium]|nr:peptide deformylase [Candidatus Eisenbacteria bacterium]
MSVRRVVIYGDPVLRRKAGAVTSFDDTLRALVADLFETARAYNGVGLAANQVGVPQRVFIIDVPIGEGLRDRFAVVNPVIDRREGKESGEEGCLSMPGLYEDVVRAERVRVRGFDEHGKPVERVVEGYLARAVQHEADHLDGVLFTDRLSPLKKQFLRRQLDELARGEIPEGYHPGERSEERL